MGCMKRRRILISRRTVKGEEDAEGVSAVRSNSMGCMKRHRILISHRNVRRAEVAGRRRITWGDAGGISGAAWGAHAAWMDG